MSFRPTYTPPETGKLLPSIPFEDYERGPGVRASDLHRFRRSPAHWRAWKDSERKETEAFRFGRIFHRALENPERFMDTLVVEPIFEGPTKEGKLSRQSAVARHMRDEWYAGLAPRTMVLYADEVETITGMMNAVLKHRLVAPLIRKGVHEVSAWAECPETGEILQFRPDFIGERGHLVDFKTTRNAHRSFFINEIFSSRYESSPFYALSVAHYAYMAKLLRCCSHEAMYLIAIEKEPPYGIVVYPLDAGCIDVGERMRAPLLREYARCRKAGVWPSYEEKAVPVEIPQYVQYQDDASWLDREQGR